MSKFREILRGRIARGAGHGIGFIVVAVCAMLFSATSTLRAHETDQYSVPVGRQFADLRFWYSEYMYDRLKTALDASNQKIQRTLRDNRSTEATIKAQSPDSLAWTLLLQFPPVIHYTETLEMQLKNAKLRARFPGLVISYLPAQWIYHHPLLMLDPTKLPRLSRSSTIMVNGTYFGTDKVVHFVHMGYLYFATYRKSLARGESVEAATKKAINEGAGSSIFSENNMLGFLPTGVVSNGDKAADYVGMKFFLNLIEPVMLKGQMQPPLWVRDGEFYRFNSHVRPDTDFFSVFVSNHYNEALNPNTYSPGQARWVMEEVRKRCPDVLAWYRDSSGRAYTKSDFRRIAEGLTTYYGEDYGWDGNLDDMVSIVTACFDETQSQTASPTRENEGRDSLGRTALWRAARTGRLADVQRLAHKDIVQMPDLDGETPLHAAVRGRSSEVVPYLLQMGALANSANKHGVTPLHLAVQENSFEIVESLLAAGANAESRDQFGCTPLHDAARTASPSIAARLLKAGADVQTADNFGSTALHRASRAGRLDIVQLLLSAGADPTAANSIGRTPFDEARTSRNQSVLVALKQSSERGGSFSER